MTHLSHYYRFAWACIMRLISFLFNFIYMHFFFYLFFCALFKPFFWHCLHIHLHVVLVKILYARTSYCNVFIRTNYNEMNAQQSTKLKIEAITIQMAENNLAQFFFYPYASQKTDFFIIIIFISTLRSRSHQLTF